MQSRVHHAFNKEMYNKSVKIKTSYDEKFLKKTCVQFCRPAFLIDTLSSNFINHLYYNCLIPLQAEQQTMGNTVINNLNVVPVLMIILFCVFLNYKITIKILVQMLKFL